MAFYIEAGKDDAPQKIALRLRQYIFMQKKNWSHLVFLCIGSDRATGDCLGPYVGRELNRLHSGNFFVYGTLEHPVHALNLNSTCSQIYHEHPHALIIAIDASLGNKKHLGCITIHNGSLRPGAGVHKELPPVGDIHITGIVNTEGILSQLTLQTTRLSTVVSLAEAIVQGIVQLYSDNINYTNAFTCW